MRWGDTRGRSRFLPRTRTRLQRLAPRVPLGWLQAVPSPWMRSPPLFHRNLACNDALQSRCHSTLPSCPSRGLCVGGSQTTMFLRAPRCK